MTNRKRSEPAQFISKNSRTRNGRKCKKKTLWKMPAFVFHCHIFFRFLFQSSREKLRWLRTLSVCYCGLEDLNRISYVPNIVSLCVADNQISADNNWSIGNSVQIFKATMTNCKRSEPVQFISKNSTTGNGREM